MFQSNMEAWKTLTHPGKLTWKREVVMAEPSSVHLLGPMGPAGLISSWTMLNFKGWSFPTWQSQVSASTPTLCRGAVERSWELGKWSNLAIFFKWVETTNYGINEQSILLMVQKSAVHQLRLVVCHIIYSVLYNPGAGFLPSTVWKRYRKVCED